MFKTKTVDSIMAVFTNTIRDLEVVSNTEEVRQYNLTEEQGRIEQELNQSREEAGRANKLIKNLRSLVE
tara:strand:- start:975 stop:1181 length:207 start_codon:yes stop_codon:yes gene_type:complete